MPWVNLRAFPSNQIPTELKKIVQVQNLIMTPKKSQMSASSRQYYTLLFGTPQPSNDTEPFEKFSRAIVQVCRLSHCLGLCQLCRFNKLLFCDASQRGLKSSYVAAKHINGHEKKTKTMLFPPTASGVTKRTTRHKEVIDLYLADV